MPPELAEQNENNNEQQVPPTTNSNPPAPSPVQNNGDPMRDLLFASMQEENARLRQQLEQNNRTPEQPLFDKPAKELLFEDPEQLIGKLVQKHINAALAPVLETTAQMRRNNEIEQWVTQVRNIPQYSSVLPHIEQDLRATLAQVPQLNGNTVMAALNIVIGNFAVRNGFQLPGNQAPSNSNNNPAPQQNNNPTPTPVAPSNLPAHLRPSGAPSGANTPRKPKVELTELEMRLAREDGLTPEQYVELRDLDSQSVATFKFGGK